MPAIKVKPSPKAKKRDFWGDKIRGTNFKTTVDEKFGTKHGIVKTILAELKLHRRLYNMYITGEREIPDEVWQRLNDYNPKKKKRKIAPTPVVGQNAAPRTLFVAEEIDPLS